MCMRFGLYKLGALSIHYCHYYLQMWMRRKTKWMAAGQRLKGGPRAKMSKYSHRVVVVSIFPTQKHFSASNWAFLDATVFVCSLQMKKQKWLAQDVKDPMSPMSAVFMMLQTQHQLTPNGSAHRHVKNNTHKTCRKCIFQFLPIMQLHVGSPLNATAAMIKRWSPP